MQKYLNLRTRTQTDKLLTHFVTVKRKCCITERTLSWKREEVDNFFFVLFDLGTV